MARREFYPEIEPYDSGYLPVGGRHQIYYEQCGNPNGAPVVFLHGGPGAGSSPVHRRFFDPTHYRIIVFDQRGAGRSKPLGEITDNTTPHLIGCESSSPSTARQGGGSTSSGAVRTM